MSFQQSGHSDSRRLAAVWFADIVGFTALSTCDEPLALRVVEVLQTASRNAAERNGGTVVKFLGDGVLAQFSSAEGAAKAALQLQLRFRQLTEGWSRGPHQLRIGVHLGDVVIRPDGDIMGDGVNRASRLQGLAEPGQILVSDEVRRQLRRRPDMCLTDCGTRIAKGIDEPIAVYQVEASEDLAKALLLAAVAPSPPRAKERKRHSTAIAVGMAVGILSFVTLGVWTALGGDPAPALAAHDSHADSFSVAVLPFHYLSSDEADAYIADGISEALIHGLARVPELLGKNSSEAAVAQSGAGGAESDDGSEAGARREGAAGGQRPSTPASATREERRAYEHLLRGRHALSTGTRASLAEAVRHFNEALALAPSNAEAHLSMAQAQMKLAEVGARTMARALPEVRRHLDETLRLAPDMPEAHAGLALLLAAYEWDWDGAEREFESALAQAPTPSVRRTYAGFLSARGRYDEALGQLDLAFHQEPGAVPNVTARDLVLFRAGRYQQARVVLNEAVRLAPDNTEARVLLARTHVELGSPETALEVLGDQERAARDPIVRFWNVRVRLDMPPAQPQVRERLVRTLQDNLSSAQTRVPDGPYYLASLKLALGDRAGATQSLRRAFEARSPSLMWLPTDPMWEPLRTTPDFQQMVRRIESGP